jgi:outer membrane protein assembly factor BamB
MAWMRHRVWLAGIACAGAAAGLTGCSSAGNLATCGPPPQRTWVLEVTSAGEVRWQTRLPLQEGVFDGTAPVVAGSMAIFSQDDVVYALRLADGHRVWSWSSEYPVQDVFQWQRLVVVYASGDRVGLLTGLDAATGQIRWTRQTGQALPGDAAATADGGLAMMVPNLEVVNLSDGRVRWTRPDGVPVVPAGTVQSAIAVSGGAVLLAANGRLTSYDDQTGKVRWTNALTSLLNTTPIELAASPGPLGLKADAGLVYLTDMLQQPGAIGPVTPVLLGINAVNGQLKWRFTLASEESATIVGPGLVSAESDDGVLSLDDLSPVNGQLRWQLVGIYGTEQMFFADGELAAITSISDSGQGLLTAIGSTDGHRVWQVTLPTVTAFPLLPVPGGLLVYDAAPTLPC